MPNTKRTNKIAEQERLEIEALRMKAEVNCPKPVAIDVGYEGVVEVDASYRGWSNSRGAGIRADPVKWDSPDDDRNTPWVEIHNSQQLRAIAAALLAAADWMEGGK